MPALVAFLVVLFTADPDAVIMPLAPDQPNVISFAPVEARFVRVVIHASRSGQPCIDELAGLVENCTSLGSRHVRPAREGRPGSRDSALDIPTGRAWKRPQHVVPSGRVTGLKRSAVSRVYPLAVDQVLECFDHSVPFSAKRPHHQLGRVKLKALPLPGTPSLSIPTAPPSLSTICRTIESPRPWPLV